jgi:hypothetical protein
VAQSKAAIAAEAAQAHEIRKTNSVPSLWENERGWASDGFTDGLNKTFVGGNVTRAAYTQGVSPMPKKQLLAKETAVAAPPARAAKPKTPRVKAAKHSKTVSSEAVVMQTETAQSNPDNPREAIALIAYGYWEARGFGHGGDLEDWVRAEHEYRNHKAKPKT